MSSANTAGVAAAPILIVDDEPLSLGALRRVIARVAPQVPVVHALSAESAIRQIQTSPISLVLTDLRMSGYDEAGWSVVRAARAARVRVAVVTGGDVDDAARVLGAEGVTIVRKDTLDRSSVAALLSA